MALPWYRLAEGLEALITAMQTSRAAAKTAFQLLQCLTSSAQLPEADVATTEAKLAKLQAVHCCVRLLCPQHPAAETQLIATGGQNQWSCDRRADKYSMDRCCCYWTEGS